jgi:hypothetical protein
LSGSRDDNSILHTLTPLSLSLVSLYYSLPYWGSQGKVGGCYNG